MADKEKKAYLDMFRLSCEQYYFALYDFRIESAELSRRRERINTLYDMRILFGVDFSELSSIERSIWEKNDKEYKHKIA